MLSNNTLAIIVLVIISIAAICLSCFSGATDALMGSTEGFTENPVRSWSDQPADATPGVSAGAATTNKKTTEPTGEDVNEGFASYVRGVNEGAPITHTMGPWDSMAVPRSSNPDPESWWKFTPDIGPGAGVSEVLLYQDSVAAVSPMCCGAATYSTSSGCVCTTPEQRNFINARGGNRTGGNDL